MSVLTFSIFLYLCANLASHKTHAIRMRSADKSCKTVSFGAQNYCRPQKQRCKRLNAFPAKPIQYADSVCI